MTMRAIITGDLHLYYEGTNTEATEAFKEELDRNPPDLLVLGGDIYELWRRDLFGAGWATSDYTDLFQRLDARGVDVVYLVGNHDEWALRHTSPHPRYVAEPMMEYEFQSGDETFYVTHGHQFEPAYNPLTNDALAVSDDGLGSLAGTLWENRPQPPGVSFVEAWGDLALGPAASFADPTAIRNQPTRQDWVEKGVVRRAGDRYALYGHTHTPFVDDEQRLANWGAMAGVLGTYIEVVDGSVTLESIT
jgi:predicted phosphodiesterase